MAAMTLLNVSTLILSLNVILTLQAPVLNSRIRTKHLPSEENDELCTMPVYIAIYIMCNITI